MAKTERRTPDETRERLVTSASFLFNRDGFHGTDSNKIARHAGFAPGTFYKYFADKKAAFLAVYERWAASDWEAVSNVLSSSSTRGEIASGLVALQIEAQRGWHGFRASLGTLTGDPDVRALRRDHRTRHLELIASLREQAGGPKKSREQDALLLFTLERGCDALADFEATDLRLSEKALVRELEALLEKEIGKGR